MSTRALCESRLIYYVKESWPGEVDTDLPLINTYGDQGERQDDEDGSSHINHTSFSLPACVWCVCLCMCVSVCVFVFVCVSVCVCMSVCIGLCL